MTVQEIRRKAKQFKKTFGVRDCSRNSLQKATEAQGYTVVEFNHIFNDEAVQSSIDVLKLSENILKSKGFNDYACAGIMANLYAESGLNPKNLSNSKNKLFDMTDDEFYKNIRETHSCQ